MIPIELHGHIKGDNEFGKDVMPGSLSNFGDVKRFDECETGCPTFML